MPPATAPRSSSEMMRMSSIVFNAVVFNVFSILSLPAPREGQSRNSDGLTVIEITGLSVARDSTRCDGNRGNENEKAAQPGRPFACFGEEPIGSLP